MPSPLLIGAGAVAAVVLLGRTGRAAGAANTAAADRLRGASVGGVTWDVPANANMVAAWESMRAALGTRELTTRELHEIADVWLKAYAAGAAAGLAGSRDYALITEAAYFGESLTPASSFTHPGSACLEKFKPFRTELGQAVCAVSTSASSLNNGLGRYVDFAELLAQTRAVAVAMDNADFRREGERRSDREPAGLLDAPGIVISRAAGFVGDAVVGLASTPLALAGVVALVAWKVLR